MKTVRKLTGAPRVGRNRMRLGWRLAGAAAGLRKGLGRTVYLAALAVLGIATLLASAAAVYAIVRSPYFELSAIEVRGTNRLTGLQVMDMAGLGTSPSIFNVPVRRIEKTLAGNPWIEQALARRKFPDRLVVDVKERSPRAIAHLGDLRYVDREGVVFKRVSPGESMNFPVLTGLSEGDVEDPAGRELLARALELVRLWESAEGLGVDRLSEIHIAKGRGLTVITRGDGAQIQFGLDNFPLKMDKLLQLLDRLEEQHIRARHIDLSFRNMIVVKPARHVEKEGTVGL